MDMEIWILIQIWIWIWICVQAKRVGGESKTDESAPSTSINAQCQRNGRQFLKYFHWKEENTL